ncbi:MAG: PAS domain-containing protein [Methyloceanibacter sp.]|nr:PAS domain-containing protein [Methyloceanibacter sp.]
MDSSQLAIFDAMPFLFWAKSEDGRYVWGNRKINEFAKQNVLGKTDDDLPWADNAEALREDDREVLRTGKPIFRHEYVDQSEKGQATLSVCKFPGVLDGARCVMGVSFVIE